MSKLIPLLKFREGLLVSQRIPGALRWWMVAGPELSRSINDFEGDTVDVGGLEHN